VELFADVRAGNGPVFVEARTYRFVGHSRSDPGRYRPEGELEKWQARDPLELARIWLREHLDGGEQRLAGVDADVEAMLGVCEANSLAAAFPTATPDSEFKE
jgi:TPP-dependent pyruvate/acetoin dehydrogenase alpha subunit